MYRRTTLIHILAIFLLALGVRFLTWQDNRRDIWKVQTAVTAGYKEPAHQLLRGEFGPYFSDVNHLGHPPGYPLVIAALEAVFGPSDAALQWFQIIADSLAVVLLYLIVLELLPVPIALPSGLLAALSPQFAYFTTLLLPDSLIVLPLLGSFYFLLRARTGWVLNYLIAGFLIGVSCWLRANALFLAPFLALCTPIFVVKGERVRSASLVILGLLLAITPITIKNAIVFRQFVPVSLGAGQTLLEGIADYDEQRAFNIPQTDMGIMKQEAEWSGRPEYAQWLFGADGIERDRKRVARGLSVIKSHPFWFAGVMVQRATASTRLDPVPVLLPESPVSSDLSSLAQQIPVKEYSRSQFQSASTPASGVTVSQVENQWLYVKGNGDNYGDQLFSEPLPVRPGFDHAFLVRAKLNSGRVLLKVVDQQQRLLASTVLELSEVYTSERQPVHELIIPFTSNNSSQVSLVVANDAAPNSGLFLDTVRLLELRPSTGGWLRYVRVPLRTVQKIFKTAIMIPLAVIGLAILLKRREFHAVVFLALIPAYYLIAQSTLHTERRYVYVIHFFFTVFASTTLVWLFELASNKFRAKTHDAT